MVQGMGDDFPVGYSLNQGGWGWGGFGGNFQMDLSNLFAITMANFRFPNFTGGGSMWNGFIGGGMGNFQMSPFGGAEYNFSTSGSSSSGSTKTIKTSEDRIADKKVKNKHEAMTNLLKKYLDTLKSDSDDYLKLDDLLKHDGKPKTQDGYDALKTYYNANKGSILTAIKGTDDWKKNVELNMNDTINGKKFSKSATGDYLSGDSLKSDIDVMELMECIEQTGCSWFHLDNPADSVPKLNKAIYNALKKKVSDLKSGSSYKFLSKTTKEMLDKAYSFAADSESKDSNFGTLKDKETTIESACAQMYYWLRIANAEVYANNYACLSDDFADDALLGKNAIVNSTRKDLHSTERYKDGADSKRKTDVTASNTWKVKYDGS